MNRPFECAVPHVCSSAFTRFRLKFRVDALLHPLAKASRLKAELRTREALAG